MSRSSIIFSPDHGKLERSLKNLEDGFTKNEQPENEWENDPANARNWSIRRKWMMLSVVSLYALLPYLGNTMLAPGLPTIAEKYHVNNPSVIGLSITVYLISSYLGPLVLAPLSEIYGRRWVLHITTLSSLGFNLASAFAPNVRALIIFRLLAGFSGNGALIIGLGVVSDMYAEAGRTIPTTFLTVSQSINLIGPVIGGEIIQSLGIKWVFIIITIAHAVACLAGISLLQETYSAIIQGKQVQRSVGQEATINISVLGPSRQKEFSVFLVNVKRPIILLFQSNICLIFSLYLAIFSGIITLVGTQVPKILEQIYGFHARDTGLVSLGSACAALIAMFVTPKVVDYIYEKLSERNRNQGTPEMRMPALFFSALLIPLGLLWFGWSVQARLHWIMPVIGLSSLDFALIASTIPIRIYLIDIFNVYSASAIAATFVLCTIPVLAFPLFGAQMYNELGIGGGNTLLAGLAIVLLLPIPVFVYCKGEALRARSQLTCYLK